MAEFSRNFLWGGATSNAQAEGACTADGKGLNVYDTYVVKQETGQASVDSTDLAANHYRQYKEDIALMKEMGFRAYRFSVLWSRINPKGIETEPNKAGLDFYEDMIDELHKAGIEPVVSLVHFDMPDYLAKTFNGFADSRVVDLYAMHVEQVVERLKDKVKYWITYNEINTAPAMPDMIAGATRPEHVGRAEFYATIVHNTQLAHARAVEIIKAKCPDARVSGMINYTYFDPSTCSPWDVEASHIANTYSNFLAFDIMTRGEYPDYYKAFLKNRGLPTQREGMDIIRAAAQKLDFLAFSYYQTATICGDPEKTGLELEDDIIFHTFEKVKPNEHFKRTHWGWAINPTGLKLALETLSQRYHKPLFIVENGMARLEEPDGNGQINDEERIDYYRGHIQKMYEAMVQENVDLMGYLAWAPFDFLSSHKEMRKRYGFIYIGTELKDGKLARIPKKSFYWYKKVIESDGKDLG